MRKICSLLIVSSIFLLLFAPSFVIAGDLNLSVGDTYIYEVSDLDIPWDKLPEIESPFDMSVLDFSGSTLAVKVMDMKVESNVNWYVVNTYIILDKASTIPIPEEELTPDIQEIFGDTFELPAGIGLGLGDNIPGTDFIGIIDGISDEPGLPFCLDSTRWNDIANWFNSAPIGGGLTLDVTNEGAEFKLSLSGFDEGNLNISWHRTGDFAGVFKSISGDISADIDGSVETIKIQISFDKMENNALPSEIQNEETITLNMKSASMEYTLDGAFERPENYAQFGAIKGLIDGTEGLDLVEFNVIDTWGCYYATEIALYDGSKLTKMSDPITWNGFTGFPTGELTAGFDPWSRESHTIGIVPILAPGVTPDWDMWRASTKTFTTIIDILVDSLTSSSAATELSKDDITLNTLEVTYELRGNADFKYFYMESNIDIGVDYTGEPGYPTGAKMAIISDETLWLAYTAEGLIAGIGADVSVKVTVTNFPSGSGTPQSGYATVDLNVELNNKDIAAETTLPDPKDLPAENGDGGAGGITPGFAFIPALLIFSTTIVILKRKK